LFSSDQETSAALNSLTTVVRDQSRPLIMWVGAGVSSWAGYPNWLDLAAEMHSKFSREESGYNKGLSSQLLNEAKYPQLFEQMRIANQHRYFTFLSTRFRPQVTNGVYKRFIRAICNLSNTYIVTTNVDEALERSLPDHSTIQRSDIECLSQLLHQRTPFICKLHGSVSAVESMVFSQCDYDSIQVDNVYLDALQTLFLNATVLFLGYGVRDEYVLRRLQSSSVGRSLFGTGPHFIVTSEERTELPSTIRRIRYEPEQADHRDALQILEIIADFVKSQPIQAAQEYEEKTYRSKSLYYIADLVAPGKWSTSQTISFAPLEGEGQHQAIVGEGYVNDEIEFYNYSALHDIVVGLLCFDVVCVSIDHLTSAHELLGSEAFWIFVESGSLRLVNPPSVPAILFADIQSPIGNLGMMTPSNNNSPEEFSPISISERIRKQIIPIKGKESEAEKLFKILESTVFDMSGVKQFDSIVRKTLGALTNPSIRSMLGFSLGTPYTNIPKWLSFPTLRLAKVISNGIICQNIQASSARMIFGSEKLASVAFSSIEGKEWADNAASYVLTGRFDSDIGSIIFRERSLLLKILQFRESSVGENFRREVAECLATDNGSQIVTAINAGLTQALSFDVLQKAHDQFSSGLFIHRDTSSAFTPVVWGDLRNSDARIARWRKRSRTMLDEESKRQKLGPYDECPCGSGEKLRFCCQKALS